MGSCHVIIGVQTGSRRFIVEAAERLREEKHYFPNITAAEGVYRLLAVFYEVADDRVYEKKMNDLIAALQEDECAIICRYESNSSTDIADLFIYAGHPEIIHTDIYMLHEDRAVWRETKRILQSRSAMNLPLTCLGMICIADSDFIPSDVYTATIKAREEAVIGKNYRRRCDALVEKLLRYAEPVFETVPAVFNTIYVLCAEENTFTSSRARIYHNRIVKKLSILPESGLIILRDEPELRYDRRRDQSEALEMFLKYVLLQRESGSDALRILRYADYEKFFMGIGDDEVADRFIHEIDRFNADRNGEFFDSVDDGENFEGKSVGLLDVDNIGHELYMTTWTLPLSNPVPYDTIGIAHAKGVRTCIGKCALTEKTEYLVVGCCADPNSPLLKKVFRCRAEGQPLKIISEKDFLLHLKPFGAGHKHFPAEVLKEMAKEPSVYDEKRYVPTMNMRMIQYALMTAGDPIDLDTERNTAKFSKRPPNGQDRWNTSLSCCNCGDYVDDRNHNPCIHMYKLAYVLGYLGDDTSSSEGDAQLKPFAAKLKKEFERRSWERGVVLFESGGVMEPEKTEEGWKALVQGSRSHYTVRIIQKQRFVKMECTCPIGVNCKHIAATLLKINACEE